MPDDADLPIGTGDTYKPSVYLITPAGKVELADILNPETLSFATSDDKVVTVAEDGTITAVASGTATITATYGDQTYEWNVTVEKKPEVASPITNNTDTTEPTDGEATDIAAPNTGAEMPSVLMVIAGCVVAILAAAYSAKLLLALANYWLNTTNLLRYLAGYFLLRINRDLGYVA